MSIPKISVIVAVYNSKSSIHRMIESILSQSFYDWELIAINDGSTDGSAAILDRYASIDARIKVVHKENGGVASARQVGIEHANGEYSIHADADDWVEQDMLQEMYAKAKTENSDMVIADFFVNYPDGRQILRTQNLDSNKAEDVLYQIYAKDLFGALWHKLLKTDVYKTAGVEFEKGIDYCEDRLFLTKILYRCPNLNISYLPKAFYHYCQTDSSITRTLTPKAFDSIKRYNIRYIDFIPQTERFRDVYQRENLNVFLNGFIHHLYSNAEIESEFLKVRSVAFNSKSLRWRVGYRCIDWKLYGVARKLLRF